jgi:hypothetical protein
MLVKRREKGLQSLVTNQTRSGVKFFFKITLAWSISFAQEQSWRLRIVLSVTPTAARSRQAVCPASTDFSRYCFSSADHGTQNRLSMNPPFFYSSHAESLVATLRMPTVGYFQPITLLCRNFFYPNTAPLNIFHVTAHKDKHYRDVSCIRKSCS